MALMIEKRIRHIPVIGRRKDFENNQSMRSS